jgi:arsenical pump membrane protein
VIALLSTQDPHAVATWLLALVSIALVLIRPKDWPEAIWAVGGALLLTVSGLISLGQAAHAVAKGADVYLFLTGMMVISELARREGVFDWLAAHAVHASRGSRARLFVLIYAVGTVVTIFLSNDATAVVLTPAVLAAIRAAEAEPLPYLMICAFIANAASFVLPLSNPANLVVYAGNMPRLGDWLRNFALASLASIVVTFALLRLLSRSDLKGPVSTAGPIGPLSAGGRLTLFGIVFLAAVLMTASALDIDLGAPACACGMFILALIAFRDRRTVSAVTRGVAWSVLPLVAGLFVIVEALNANGALNYAVAALQALQHWPVRQAALTSGFGIALISNLMNNLPSGLISASAIKAAHLAGPIRDAILVGVDLGPNLSVSGSLATILWLIALRRDGLNISFWRFLKWGAVIMPPALFCALLLL